MIPRMAPHKDNPKRNKRSSLRWFIQTGFTWCWCSGLDSDSCRSGWICVCWWVSGVSRLGSGSCNRGGGWSRLSGSSCDDGWIESWGWKWASETKMKLGQLKYFNIFGNTYFYTVALIVFSKSRKIEIYTIWCWQSRMSIHTSPLQKFCVAECFLLIIYHLTP